MSQRGGWITPKRRKVSSAAAAAAAGAAAGAAAASQSSGSGRRRQPSRLSIYRAPRRPSTGYLKWGKGPFPENLWTEVVYSDQYSGTCTAGAIQSYTFAMNGLFDPNITGTGSQPRYFDTLCGANNTSAPYRAYVVKAAKIKAIAFPTGPDSTGVTGLVGITTCPASTSAPGSVTEQMQRQDTNYSYFSYYAGGKPVTTLTRTCEMAPVLGIKDIEDANGTQAAYSANPTNLVHAYITVAPMNQSTAMTFCVNVEIRYWVKFYSLNDPPIPRTLPV
jgi:hypothetical protein